MLRRFMATSAVVLIASLAAVHPADASPKDEVARTLTSFGTALAAGDVKRVVSTCMTKATVIDEFPPFVWHATGCASWWIAFGKLVQTEGMTNVRTSAKAKPNPINIAGSSAYAVMPFRMTWTDKTGPNWETFDGTFVMRRTASGWKIESVAWTNTGTGSGTTATQ